MRVVYFNDEYSLVVWEGQSSFVPQIGSLVSVDSAVWEVDSCIFYPEQDTIYVMLVEESLVTQKETVPGFSRPPKQDGAIIDVRNRQDNLEKKTRRVFAEVANLKKQIVTKSREK